MGFMGDNPVRPTVTRKKKKILCSSFDVRKERMRGEEMEGRELCCNREGK